MANVASAERTLLRYISNGNKQVSRAFSFKALVIGSFIGNVHSELDIPVAKRTLIKHCSSGQCTQARDAHPNFAQLKDSKPDDIIKCLNYKLASICETYSQTSKQLQPPTVAMHYDRYNYAISQVV